MIDIKIGDTVKITPKSYWANIMTHDYGSKGKVGALGKYSVMIVNKECVDVDDYSSEGKFHWGYWLEFDQADFEVL